MRYWKKLLSFILIIILSSSVFYTVSAFNFYNFKKEIFTNPNFFSTVKKALEYSKSGWVTIVVLKDDHAAQRARKYLNEHGVNIAELLNSKKKSKGLFFLYSGDGKLVFVFNTLSDKGIFTFKSPHTKRIGLVLDSEFVSILEGKFESYSKVSVSKHFLESLWKLFWILNYQLMYLNRYLIALFTIIILFSVLEAILYFNGCKIALSDSTRKYILRFLPTAILLSYLFIIYSPILIQYIHNIFIFLSVVFAISLALSYFNLQKTQTVIALLGIISIFIQAVFCDNYLQFISTAGYHPSFANRFYGIGNEFFSYLLGFALVLSVASKIPLKYIYLLLGALAIFLAVPYYGINFGGLMSVLLSLTLIFIVHSPQKKKIAFILVPVIIITIFVIFSNNYLLTVFSDTGVLFETIKRKIYMNLSYFTSYPLTILLMGCFIILSILVLTTNEILTLDSFEREKLKLFTVIAIFAWLLNDSGTIIVGLLLGFLNTGIYLAKLVKSYAED